MNILTQVGTFFIVGCLFSGIGIAIFKALTR